MSCHASLAWTIYEYLLRCPSSRPAGLFLPGLLDGLHVRLRRLYFREAPAGFGIVEGAGVRVLDREEADIV